MATPMLFDTDTDLLARTTDPATSREAAVSQGKNLSEIQVIVLDLISTSDSGLADFELSAQYAMWQPLYDFPAVLFDTPRRRRSDLSRMGRLVDSGFRRMNGHGRNEIVWQVKS